MKIILFLIAVVSFSIQSQANTADTLCEIKGTPYSFDLASGTPPDEGSRVFQGLVFYKTKDSTDKTEFNTPSTEYQYSLTDGGSSNGPWFFFVSILNLKTQATFHAFYQRKTGSHPAVSTVYSSLPGMTIPVSLNATLECQD